MKKKATPAAADERRGSSLTGRIFRTAFLVAAAVLLMTAAIVTGIMYDVSSAAQKQLLHDELGLAAVAVEQQGTEYLSAVGSDYRLTLVAADGQVLFDTRADAKAMENHADRDEIRDALLTGHGESARYSATLTERTLYLAQRLSDGTVLRISAGQLSFLTVALGLLQPMLIVCLLAVVLSALLAWVMGRRIVAPLETLDLDHPMEQDAYDELTPLLRRIDSLHRRLRAQMLELKERTEQFAQITNDLNEGLVLLDEKGLIVQLNPAAAVMYGAPADCVGDDFLILDRTPAMSRAIEDALHGGHGTLTEERSGREYRIDVSQICAEGRTVGAAVLAFDMTDQLQAERSRREFTANVSHELKTPLQTIMGSAELIENGVAAPQDVPRFAGKIRSEAARLVTLIEDIIRLSQLDENADSRLPRETVDLGALCRDVAQQLTESAAAQDVTVTADGGARLPGVHRLMYEIVYNLTDNAIRYNKPGGHVDITVREQPDTVVLTVADSGIGIPPEHRARVFERFYRVDKSHSRACGGTGLGLSIVKHAAAALEAKIDLDSTPDVGTTVTVTFPKDARPAAEQPTKDLPSAAPADEG